MARRRLVAAAILMASLAAQAGNDPDASAKVLAVVAYINHGERTPAMSRLRKVLTPEGAQQMWRQGSAFRSRYLAGRGNGPGVALIQDLDGAKDAIDNTQLSVLSQTDEWVAAGAVAFMQGLYPPKRDAFVHAAGGTDLGRDYLNQTHDKSYPLNGYQYPQIQTLSAKERSSIGIQGDVACTAWQYETGLDLANTQEVRHIIYRTRKLYQKLFLSAPLKDVVPIWEASYMNAYELYNLVKYMYTHNRTVFQGLENANDTLNALAANAFQFERVKASHKSEDRGGALNSIPGRTLAYQIVKLLRVRVLRGRGEGEKMTLMFGSLSPLLSFLSVSGLLTGENLISGPFSRLPEPGAAMVFELVSHGKVRNPGATLAASDLSVRFYYRATANADDTFKTYPLFGSEFDGPSIPYISFVRSMQIRGIGPRTWCDLCQAEATVSWCPRSQGSMFPGRRRISPVAGGGIGAALMLALVGIVSTALIYFGGFRVRRLGKGERSSVSGAAGGFKGAARTARDADVSVSKDGTREERVGSWEMRVGASAHGAASTTSLARIVTKEFRRPSSQMDDDDGASISGAPVKPHEGV